MMMVSDDLLFALLRNELWNHDTIELSLSDEEIERLFKNARKQAVSGLVANCLIRNNASISKVSVLKCLALINRIKQTNILINNELGNFAKLMNLEGLDYIVVKGQTVATFYNNPLLRMPGDIDFYCDPQNFYSAKQLFEKLLGKEIIGHSAKHIEFKINNIQFELHAKLTEFSYYKHNIYWEKILAKDLEGYRHYVGINGSKIPVLSPTFNVLYLFCHIFYHLIINGIGLRQFCDLALFLNRHNNDINKDDLACWLSELGLMRVFVATGYLLVDILGMPSEDFPFEINDRDKKNGLRILNSVLTDGDWAKDRFSVRNKGFLHSIETGYVCAKQSLKYFDMAPMESLLRMPKLGQFFIWKLLNRDIRD